VWVGGCQTGGCEAQCAANDVLGCRWGWSCSEQAGCLQPCRGEEHARARRGGGREVHTLTSAHAGPNMWAVHSYQIIV
jgi:hypothetical protein